MISECTNEDCMLMMARYPDKFFDLAIVDPPYGIGMGCGAGETRGNGKKKKDLYIQKDWDLSTPNKQYFDELIRVSNNQLIFGGNYSDGELIYTSFDTTLKEYTQRPEQGNRMHPTQKPTEIYYWLLQNYAADGDKILDTHLGSGSSRIAAYKLGFDFWGCEIDKDYFEAQEKRFKEAINEPLFQTQPERIQAKLL